MAEEEKKELQQTENQEVQATNQAEETSAPETAPVVEEKVEDAPQGVDTPEVAETEIPQLEVSEDIWDTASDDGFGEEYSDTDRKRMEALYESTMNSISEKEVMEGVVVGITDRDVIVNIGFKSDGLVSLSEFRDVDLKTGDTVEVYVEEQENSNGQLVLSRRKAKIVKAWENIQGALDNDSVIDG
ncbi:MAG: S1 RNA-binding domain-containing protein, partial [Cyclobacteriaceae bacterium]